ncbi:hypothetical protein DV736_g4283, partial [Chaetothyriales sp. CBS 134916]
MTSRKSSAKKNPDLPTSADEIVPFSHSAAGHEGISTSASGSVLIKPCTQAEIDFYHSAATDPRHEFFYAHMPTFYGELKMAPDQFRLGPLLSQEGGVAPLPALPLHETVPVPAAEPGPGILALHATTTSLSVKRSSGTWKPSFGKKLETGLAIAIENAAAGVERPCILDVKLGARLWADDAPLAKRQKFDNIARESTSGSLGFRVAGVKVWLGEGKTAQKENLSYMPAISRDENHFTIDEHGYVGYGKMYGRMFNKDNVKDGFITFLGGLNDQGKLVRKHAKMVRDRFARELESIAFVLENEESRMYSASILLVYEGDDEKMEAAQQYENEQGKDINGQYFDTTSEGSSPDSPNNINQIVYSTRPMPDNIFDYNTAQANFYPTPQLDKIPVEYRYTGSSTLDDRDRRRRRSGNTSTSGKDKENVTNMHLRRRAQNRASQRAFRERKEKHLKGLEHQLENLHEKHQDLLLSYSRQADEVSRLNSKITKLTSELNAIRSCQDQSFSEIVLPDKFDKFDAFPSHEMLYNGSEVYFDKTAVDVNSQFALHSFEDSL